LIDPKVEFHSEEFPRTLVIRTRVLAGSQGKQHA
jgi:hypothetical protein